jgi:hypothetical protein
MGMWFSFECLIECTGFGVAMLPDEIGNCAASRQIIAPRMTGESKRAKGFEPSTFTLGTTGSTSPKPLQDQPFIDQHDPQNSATISAETPKPVVVRLDQSLSSIVRAWPEISPDAQQWIFQIVQSTKGDNVKR